MSFGFTEPYLFDKPIQTGFTMFYQRYSYNQGRQASILYGQNLIGYYNSLGQQNLLNYVSNGRGFTTFITHQLKRSFARVGLTYGYNIQTLTPLTTLQLPTSTISISRVSEGQVRLRVQVFARA